MSGLEGSAGLPTQVHVNAVDINAWYHQYGEPIFRRCFRIVGEEALAMDLMQETFLRAHKYQRSYRGPAPLGAGDGREILKFCFAIPCSRGRRWDRNF